MPLALADHLVAGRMGNEMGEPLHRHRVAVANIRLHGGGKGHEFGHRNAFRAGLVAGYLGGGGDGVKWRGAG